MKLLQIHAEFKLSDDFDGTMSDALREMADYCESPEADAREVLGKEKEDTSLTIQDWQEKSLDKLIELNEKDGTRTVFNAFFGEWPKEDK